MNSGQRPASEYDEVGDFYYNFVKNKLAAPDSFAAKREQGSSGQRCCT